MMNGTNQLLCDYCKETCSKLQRERKRRWWWCCYPCETYFLSDLRGKIEIIRFKSPGKTKFYDLELDFKKNTSYIHMVEALPNHNYKDDRFNFKSTQLMIFPKLITNVTPQNATDKMKMYMLFS